MKHYYGGRHRTTNLPLKSVLHSERAYALGLALSAAVSQSSFLRVLHCLVGNPLTIAAGTILQMPIDNTVTSVTLFTGCVTSGSSPKSE